MEYCSRAIRDSGDYLSGTWLCLPGWHHRGSPLGAAESSTPPQIAHLKPCGCSALRVTNKCLSLEGSRKGPICIHLNFNDVLGMQRCVSLRTSVANSQAVQSGWIVWDSVTIPLISRQDSQESLFSPVDCQGLSLLTALIPLASSSTYQTPAVSTSPYSCLGWCYTIHTYIHGDTAWRHVGRKWAKQERRGEEEIWVIDRRLRNDGHRDQSDIVFMVSYSLEVLLISSATCTVHHCLSVSSSIMLPLSEHYWHESQSRWKHLKPPA